MIDLDALKPLLEPLVTGRDDSADILEKINALNVVEPEESEIESRIATAVAEAEARARAEYNRRYESAFFAQPTDAPPVSEEETTPVIVDEVDDINDEITLDEVINDLANETDKES